MNRERPFRVLWEQQEFEVPDAPADLCVYAQQYEAWMAQLIADVDKARTLGAVNVAFLHALHKYFEWRVVVPKSHRNRIGEMGHTCLFHVLEAGYIKLRTIQLSLQPPPITIPSPPAPPQLPPAPPPLQISGIFVGEDDA